MLFPWKVRPPRLVRGNWLIPKFAWAIAASMSVIACLSWEIRPMVDWIDPN